MVNMHYSKRCLHAQPKTYCFRKFTGVPNHILNPHTNFGETQVKMPFCDVKCCVKRQKAEIWLPRMCSDDVSFVPQTTLVLWIW